VLSRAVEAGAETLALCSRRNVQVPLSALDPKPETSALDPKTRNLKRWPLGKMPSCRLPSCRLLPACPMPVFVHACMRACACRHVWRLVKVVARARCEQGLGGSKG